MNADFLVMDYVPAQGPYDRYQHTGDTVSQNKPIKNHLNEEYCYENYIVNTIFNGFFFPDSFS